MSEDGEPSRLPCQHCGKGLVQGKSGWREPLAVDAPLFELFQCKKNALGKHEPEGYIRQAVRHRRGKRKTDHGNLSGLAA